MVEDMARHVECASPAVVEQEWRNWLRRQDRIVRPGSDSTANLLARFRDHLVYRPADMWAAGATNVAQALSISDLVARRGEPWARIFARTLAENVRRLAVGRDSEFAALAEAFGALYDSIAAGRMGLIVNRRLRHAMAALRDMEGVIRTRIAYLDACEQRLDPPPADDDGQHLVEKSALRTYIDDIERRSTGASVAPAPPAKR
jgi:hypothetical protein